MVTKEQFSCVDGGLLVRGPAKINLSLLIAGKRPDGFHEIETIMVKVTWYDEIFIEHSRQKGIELICKGPYEVPEGKDNIVYQACDMMLKNLHLEGGVKITLTKNVPAGAGLGSGSSDAAATLLGLNRFLQSGLTNEKLKKMAEKLGSDVTFFLDGPLALCRGKGEKTKKLSKNFDFSALLVIPDVNCSTKRVYDNYRHDSGLYNSLSGQINGYIEKNRIDLLSKMCANMLQASCFHLYKEVGELKKLVESLCKEPFCLSGSGCCLFCIFDETEQDKMLLCRQKIKEKTGCNSIVVSNNRW